MSSHSRSRADKARARRGFPRPAGRQGCRRKPATPPGIRTRAARVRWNSSKPMSRKRSKTRGRRPRRHRRRRRGGGQRRRERDVGRVPPPGVVAPFDAAGGRGQDQAIARRARSGSARWPSRPSTVTADAVERRLEARPVGVVAERRRHPAVGVGDAVVGRDDGVAVDDRPIRTGASRPERPAGRLGHLGDDLAADRLDLLVGERPLGRLQRHLDGERLLAGAERVALEEVEDR